MKVNIQGLKRGVNLFEYDADLEALSLDAANYEVLRISVWSSVDKGDENIVVNSRFRAGLQLSCDSCLEPFKDNFEDQFTLVYTSVPNTLDDDDIVRLLSQNTQLIDLAEGLREAVLLSLPMHFKCSQACKGLCDQCGANMNVDSCNCKKVSVDPRWEGLRKLLGESGTD